MAFRFPVRKENDEVYYAEDPFVVIGPEEFKELKAIAAVSPRQRSRLCVHYSADSILHEMFIVHGRDAYVRPHRHLNRQEGLFVIEGCADLLTFSDSGRLQRVVRLDADCFFNRLNLPIYHMIRIRCEYLVFYEATSGPFQHGDTELAPWAPPEADVEAVQAYLADLDAQAAHAGCG